MGRKSQWDRERYVPIYCEAMRAFEVTYSALGQAHESSRTQLGRAYAVRDGDGWQCAYCGTRVRVVTAGQRSATALRSSP